MGMLGEMFPGRKLQSEAGEDGDGQTVVDPWDIDLDSGVVRLRPMRAAAPAAKPGSAGKSDSARKPDPARDPDSEGEPWADSGTLPG